MPAPVPAAVPAAVPAPRAVTSRMPGLVLTDHHFTVPLDHASSDAASPDSEQISVYAREVVSPKREHDDLPWLLFLQGGPGGKSPRPTGRTDWLQRALDDYRVLLLDQRGTGRSTPASRQTLARRGGPNEQAAYLRHFRADAIVADAEHIRRRLLGPEGRWTLLGQSYGGFCALTYLSQAPEALSHVFVTGGLAPLSGTADDVYRATYARVLDRNRRYYERYPDDVERAGAVARHLRAHDVRLPSGDVLTVPRFRQLGMAFGMSDGFERVHYLLEEAFADSSQLSDSFLVGVEESVSFATNPLYAVLHEAAYCQGGASRWSAERMRGPEFDEVGDGPLLFTGEMIYPWMFDVDSSLRPLRDAAHILAEVDDWPALYDAERLRSNTVPVAAAVYDDDMYVERTFSTQTARTVRDTRTWVTNEYDHDGLRVASPDVLGRLIDMARGER